ncbi:MAG: hypothetical protein QG608_1238 [Actinomycetota bacterium]|nr:hypothetical protein [Actinomycetota bacterium]
MKGYVGLTFDDGPTELTEALLRALVSVGARATMFNLGAQVEKLPHLVRAEADAGMWLGNHSATHRHLPVLSEHELLRELDSTQQSLSRVSGTTPSLFRPPYGEADDRIRSAAARMGLIEVLWTADSRDWAGAGPEEIVKASDDLEPGGILLLHDGLEATVEAVPRLVARLAERGLSPGRIAFTSREIPAIGRYFHAMATA